jgi:1-acyl-sn-glycerol-3-phosphate acyltransferase
VEKIQAQCRALFRLIVFCILAVGFFAQTFFVHYTEKDPIKRRRFYVNVSSKYACILMWMFNVKVLVKNQPPKDTGYLHVQNHMGFFDVLILASVTSNCFVTSQEMREYPFLGLICEMGGCLFVERRDRSKIFGELETLAQAMRDGFRVTLYPEATSTNGEQVLPFKKTLLTSAATAGVALQPVVFNWVEIEGEPFTLKNRDKVCWYGDMGFAPSMWSHLMLKSVVAEVEYLEPMYPTLTDDRTVISEGAHNRIAEKFRSCVQA